MQNTVVRSEKMQMQIGIDCYVPISLEASPGQSAPLPPCNLIIVLIPAGTALVS